MRFDCLHHGRHVDTATIPEIQRFQEQGGGQVEFHGAAVVQRPVGVQAGRRCGRVLNGGDAVFRQQARHALHIVQRQAIEQSAGGWLHQVTRGLVELAVGLAGGIDTDGFPVRRKIPADGLRRESHNDALLIDRASEGQGIDRAVVAVIAPEDNRVLRRGRVQRIAQRAETARRLVADGVVPLIHRQPLPGRQIALGDAAANQLRHPSQVHRLTLHVTVADVDDAHGVDMHIVQSGQHHAALEIHYVGLGAYQGLHTAIIAHEGDSLAADRDRAGGAPLGVGCVDHAVDEDHVGRLPRGRGSLLATGRKQGDCSDHRQGSVIHRTPRVDPPGSFTHSATGARAPRS